MTVDAGEGGGAANSGQQVTMFTQDQVNHFNKQAKQGALDGYFKELGLDSAPSPEALKAVMDKASQFDQLQQGQKGDVERLTGELGTANEKAAKVPGLELTIQRQQIAGELGLKPRYWKYVEGKTEDEIKESAKAVLADLGNGGTGEGNQGEEGDQQQQSVGTGARPPEPNPQQGTGGGKPTGKSMKAGAEAYAAKHKKE